MSDHAIAIPFQATGMSLNLCPDGYYPFDNGYACCEGAFDISYTSKTCKTSKPCPLKWPEKCPEVITNKDAERRNV